MSIKDSFDRLKSAFEALKEAEVSPIYYRSLFPRTIFGEYQDDPLMRAMAFSADHNRSISKLSATEISKIICDEADPRGLLFRSYLEHDHSKASEFFQALAERLRHLETYRPTARDFAIEELQNAFVGLGNSEYRPTIGEVREMAKQRLRNQGKKDNFAKATWSDLMKEAFSGDELLPGKAGRPQTLGENLKAERELKALITKHVNNSYHGDFKRALEVLKPAIGTRAEYHRSEQDRLKATRSDPGE